MRPVRVVCSLFLAVVAGASACTTARPATVAAADQGPKAGCFSSPPLEGALASYVTRLLSATDDGTVRLKKSAGLMGVAATEVEIVRDSALCHRAAVARRDAKAVEHRGALIPVILVRAGPNRYFLYDGGQVGEFREYAIFDAEFNYIHSLAT